MKPKKAWAIVHSGGEIDTWDHRLPVYWYRSTAKRDCKEMSFADSKVVRVLITEIPRKKGK